MQATLIPLSLISYRSIISLSFLWQTATAQWADYPNCIIPCLQFYFSSICGGYIDACICQNHLFAGGVAECARAQCGITDGGSTIAGVWTTMRDSCLNLGIVMMGQAEFDSSAGFGTNGIMPITTTATIVGLSPTFTISPSGSSAGLGGLSNGGQLPTTTGLDTSAVLTATGSSSRHGLSTTIKGKIPLVCQDKISNFESSQLPSLYPFPYSFLGQFWWLLGSSFRKGLLWLLNRVIIFLQRAIILLQRATILHSGSMSCSCCKDDNAARWGYCHVVERRLCSFISWYG
jgi:hypothetical protein